MDYGDEIRISGKELGAINMPDFCPRCFWIKRKCKQLPFQIFPGIFSSIDSYSKNLVHDHIDRFKCAPRSMIQALDGVIDYLKIPHWSKFIRFDKKTRINVSGVPDGLLVRNDGTLIIPDYKTAKYSKTADKLFPIYEAQLNFYRWIQEGFGSTIHSTPLIYCEPQPFNSQIWDGQRDIGFEMEFHIHTVEVEQKPNLIRELLDSARTIIDNKTPPEGVHGCKDCQRLFNLIEEVNHA